MCLEPWVQGSHLIREIREKSDNFFQSGKNRKFLATIREKYFKSGKKFSDWNLIHKHNKFDQMTIFFPPETQIPSSIEQLSNFNSNMFWYFWNWYVQKIYLWILISLASGNPVCSFCVATRILCFNYVHPAGPDPGFWSGGAQGSFDPKGGGRTLSPKFAQ